MVTWILALAAGCFGGGGGGGGGVGDDAAATLMNGIGLPPGTYQADPDQAGTDPSVTVGDGSSGSSTDVKPGDMVTVNISFTAPNANVEAAGIRFGDSGPAYVVPIAGAEGNTDGSLEFTMQIPPEICDQLSQICHDIKCYEFAVTTSGQFSRENIMDLALACNNCDEPSCQDLLQECSIDNACDGQTTAGDDNPYTTQVEMGQSSGTFSLTYDMQTQKDQIIVSYEGTVLYDSGCVSNGETIDLMYSGSSTQIDVEVIPNCEDPSQTGTAWDFSISCPM